MSDDVDILMITCNRPDYTRLALGRLLDTCDEKMRVWLWHNGDDRETLSVISGFLEHPNLYRFNHSSENKRLTEPTNWLWQNAEGAFFSKVDDDCLMPHGWADVLRRAHAANPDFGVVGCWRFPPEDFVPEIAQEKIHQFNGGHLLMRNCWIEGSGYLMKRECVDQLGLLQPSRSFPNYCIGLARKGWIHGWYFPFLYQEHFDDPRSEYSLLRSDGDVQRWAPLSAVNNGVTTLAEWQAQLQRSASLLQSAPYDPRFYSGWRQQLKRVRGRVKRAFGYKRRW